MPQFVQLPAPQLATQKYDALHLLYLLGRFAQPDRWPPATLERDLENYFVGATSIDFAAAASWLAGCTIKTINLQDLVDAAWLGNTKPLHTALARQNDAGVLQLLEIRDASRLIELEDVGAGEGLVTHPLWSRAEPCLLLRLSGSDGEGRYATSLPGDSRRVVRLAWSSVLAAGISAALSVLPPAKPVDLDAIHEALHIMEQALVTAHQAHATVLGLLGLPMAAAPVGSAGSAAQVV